MREATSATRGFERGAVLIGAMLLAVACGGSGIAPSPNACDPNSTRSCSGLSGCPGTSRCGGDPPEWGQCTCLPSATDGAAPVPAELGAACSTDADCPTRAHCLSPSGDALFGGAPPAGTCVASCDPAFGCSDFSSAICVDVTDPSGADAGVMPTGLCFEACALGSAVDGGAKCHDVPTVACAPVGGGVGRFCRPLCASDADCPYGACDAERGVCVRTPRVDRTFGAACVAAGDTGANGEAGTSPRDGRTEDDGAAIDSGAQDDGAAIDSGAQDDGAAIDSGAQDDAPAIDSGAQDDAPALADGDGGIEAQTDGGSDAANASTALAPSACDTPCVAIGSASAFCSRRCVFGSTEECAPASGGLRHGGCLFPTPGGSIGDLGYCAELCDCSDDCIDPTFACDAFDDARLRGAFGRQGVCTPPNLVLHRALSCGD